MKKKILVIFFIALILSIIIYNIFNNKRKNILLISDNNEINDIILNKYKENYNVNLYTYNNITYKELIDNIKNNDSKIVKNEKIYLNQLISSADIIIINVNNNEYFNKCKKSNNIIENYDRILSMNINDLDYILKKISHAKIYIVGNYCKNKNHIQSLKIPYDYINIKSLIKNKI
ncbi:MAG: hypothetical protein ACI33S_06520 [Bacilli bacterium]